MIIEKLFSLIIDILDEKLEFIIHIKFVIQSQKQPLLNIRQPKYKSGVVNNKRKKISINTILRFFIFAFLLRSKAKPTNRTKSIKISKKATPKPVSLRCSL